MHPTIQGAANSGGKSQAQAGVARTSTKEVCARYSGRVGYETEYVIVAGIAWIRRSRVTTSTGLVDDSIWLAIFDGDRPEVHKADAGTMSIERGEIAGTSWELSWAPRAPPFETPHRLLRRFAPTRMTTTPAVEVNGRIGDRILAGAPGHTARLSGTRHAREWGWAHATGADGRWVHLLSASAPPLPRASQYATERRAPGLPIARARVEPPRLTVGPYAVEAPVTSFVGLRYLDTDGSTIWCYHSEAARLQGNGSDFPGAAMEIATREPIPGWRVGD